MESDKGSVLGTIVTWVVVIVGLVVGIKLLFWLIGAVFHVVGFAAALAAFAIFRVIPVAIVVWLIIKAVKYFRGEPAA